MITPSHITTYASPSHITIYTSPLTHLEPHHHLHISTSPLTHLHITTYTSPHHHLHISTSPLTHLHITPYTSPHHLRISTSPLTHHSLYFSPPLNIKNAVPSPLTHSLLLQDPSRRHGAMLGALSGGRVTIVWMAALHLRSAISISIRYTSRQPPVTTYTCTHAHTHARAYTCTRVRTRNAVCFSLFFFFAVLLTALDYCHTLNHALMLHLHATPLTICLGILHPRRGSACSGVPTAGHQLYTEYTLNNTHLLL